MKEENILSNIEIILGTYEEFLLGYKLNLSDDENTNVTFNQSFAIHDHSFSIRCTASQNRWLVSGGADDRIIIYDMLTRTQHGILSHHSATINCLCFATNTHIVSGSDDGSITMVRIGNWMLEKKFDKVHKGTRLLDLDIHPSGKLALSLGGDCTICAFNLIKGRKAYVINIRNKSSDAKSLNKLKISPSGDKFLLSGGLNIDIWCLLRGKQFKNFKFKSVVSSVCWLSDDIIIVGLTSGQIVLADIKNESKSIIEGHKGRIKCIQIYKNWLFSASSDGVLKAWVIDGLELKSKGFCNIDCRPTCLTIVNHLVKEKLENEKSNMIVPEHYEKVQKEINEKYSNRKHSNDWTVTEITANENKLKSKHKRRKNNFNTFNEIDQDSFAVVSVNVKGEHTTM